MALSEHPDFATFQLGRQHEAVDVDTSDAVREASLALIGQATREVVLLARHLDAVLYSNQETADVLREFVLQSRRTRVRILVKQPDTTRLKGHRLIDFAQRLSSFVEIRVAANEYHGYNAAFLVVDRTGTVYRPLSDRFEATVTFGDRQVAADLMRQFDEMWETSHSDPGLRRMAL